MSQLNENPPGGRTPQDTQVIPTEDLNSRIERRGQQLFEELKQRNYVRTDQMFGILLIAQWIAGVFVSLVVSPLAWAGSQSQLHMHVIMAGLLGAVILLPPVLLVHSKPGAPITRHSVAVSQLLFSSLLIHLTQGRIETHFHVFGSLAFLSFYRDWRVIVTATVIVATDHILRGIFAPISVYGVNVIQPWRWVEHAWWVLFEDFFLIRANINQVDEMKKTAWNQAGVEETRGEVVHLEEEQRKAAAAQEEQSEALKLRLQHINTVLNRLPVPVIGQAKDGTIFSWNGEAEKVFGYTASEIVGKHIKLIVPSAKQLEMTNLISEGRSGKGCAGYETLRLNKEGKQVKVTLTRTPIVMEDGTVLGISESVDTFVQVATKQPTLGTFGT